MRQLFIDNPKGGIELEFDFQTVGAGANTLMSIPLLDNTLYSFELRCVGRDVAGVQRAFYVRSVRAHREGGGAILGTIQNVQTDESVGAIAWNATFAVLVNDVIVQVNGSAGLTVNWAGAIRFGSQG